MKARRWIVGSSACWAFVAVVGLAASAMAQPAPHGTQQEAYELNAQVNQLYAQGRYDDAIPLAKRALEIYRKVLGEEHPSTAISFDNLAGLYQAKGDYERALEWKEQAGAIENRRLSLMLTSGSERQKQAYISTLNGSTYATASLHLDNMVGSELAARLGLSTTLERKGRVLDAQSSALRLIRQSLDPKALASLDDLVALRGALSNLSLKGPGVEGVEAHRARVNALLGQIEVLEEELGRQSALFRVENQPVTLERVQEAIEPKAALIEWVAYKPFRAKRDQDRWGALRYGVYVLRGDGRLGWANLGEAGPIDAKVDALREAIMGCVRSESQGNPCDWQASARDIAQQARELHGLLLEPVREHLEGVEHLWLAPDGQLNLLPFEVLVDPEGRHLIETLQMTYLGSGRDLLTHALASSPKGAPLLIADPDYDEARPDREGQVSAQDEAQGEAAEREGQTRSGAWGQSRWERLPGTAREAEAIGRLLADVRSFKGQQATEGLLKQAQAPIILHVATHGFFLNDQPQPVASDGRGFKRTQVGGLEAEEPQIATLENPLLRSGLVMAGANELAGGGQGEDGVLTAAEAAGLNLGGTRLVVLSACETAVGESRVGQGVYGLRRALTLAGSESQVMSLWQVSDEATEALMVDYYRRLMAGQGRTEALRAARLELLGSSQWSHPYFWSAFIPSGRSTPIQTDEHSAALLRSTQGGCAGCRVASQATGSWGPALLLILALGLGRRRIWTLTFDRRDR